MIIHFDNVPFYSQFQDIPQVEWKMEGCGIASLAMEAGFYTQKKISVPELLNRAIDSGAYAPGVGWKHAQLAALAELYGLTGQNYDLSDLGSAAALSQLESFLLNGPVIASIHNKFNPKATLGHLIVVTGLDNDAVFYHDPAYGQKTERSISLAKFMQGWKQKIIVVRAKVTKEAVMADPFRTLALLGPVSLEQAN